MHVHTCAVQMTAISFSIYRSSLSLYIYIYHTIYIYIYIYICVCTSGYHACVARRTFVKNKAHTQSRFGLGMGLGYVDFDGFLPVHADLYAYLIVFEFTSIGISHLGLWFLWPPWTPRASWPGVGRAGGQSGGQSINMEQGVRGKG